MSRERTTRTRTTRVSANGAADSKAAAATAEFPPDVEADTDMDEAAEESFAFREVGGVDTFNLATLKEMSISKLTQIAKDLDVPGATGMRKQDSKSSPRRPRRADSSSPRAFWKRCPTASASCARPSTTTCPAPTTSTSRLRRFASSTCARATPSAARFVRPKRASATSRSSRSRPSISRPRASRATRSSSTT